MREKVWRWYNTAFQSRIWPGGKQIIIMCMTGDTPVLMADGNECQLRDVKVGDKIATYDNGKLNITTVLNHKSNGYDSVYQIKTTCGKTVRANGRHPFLVNEDGQLKWIRLKNLTTAHRIVILKGSGENGREKLARLMDVVNPSAHEDTVLPTITKRCGPTVIDAIPRNLTVGLVSNTVTELPRLNMRPCSHLRTASAPSVNSHRERMYAPTGVGNYALIIATKPIQSGHFCATTATLLLDTPKPQQPPLPLLNTSDFTTTGIESITPDGVEEVFDVQIDRTENFIANGLVSHNTRWHPDDLVGRIMNSPGWEKWQVIRMPVFAEEQHVRDRNNEKYHLPPGLPDPLGRLPEEPLCPIFRPREHTLETTATYTSTQFSALYQGAPGVAEGNKIKREWLEENIVDYVPLQQKGVFRVRAWDRAGTDASSKSASSADWTVGLLMVYELETGNFYIEDVVRGQWSAAKRDAMMEETAEKDFAKHGLEVEIWHEQEPGGSGKDVAEIASDRLAKYDVHHETSTGSKETRGRPFVAACERRKMHLLRSAWNNAFIDEVIAFPAGDHDDQWDTAALAYNKLMLHKPKRKTRVH
jgi:predicted phage terminase large subunit-like protein